MKNLKKRNRLAGTGKSNSYKGMTDAQIAKKRKYDSEYQKNKVAYRVELNRKNRENHRAGKTRIGDGKDVSHLKNGKTTVESQKTNRARNGKRGSSKK